MASWSRDDVRSAWAAESLSPLWESPTAHKPPPPPPLPHLWRWRDVRPLLEHALTETSPQAVERRVLQFMDPHRASADDEYTVGNLQAGIQCLLPGESARPHRHTMNALRFVLEGEGAETIVDGKVCPMKFGDMILTPAWCWHEHRHNGSKPVLWLDALDVPLHLYLGTARFQPPPVMSMPATVPDDAFAVANLLPDDFDARQDHSPVFLYPYSNVVKALEGAPESPVGDRRVRYINPATGGPAMALLDSFVVQVEKGSLTRPARSNASAVCLVIEGEGETRIGDQVLRWEPRDILTLPQWNWISHSCQTDVARLLVVSDRDVRRRLGLFHEEIGQAKAVG